MTDKEFRIKASQLVSEMTLEEKLGLLTTHHAAVERLGLNEMFIGAEVARGYVGRSPERVSTVFPQPVGLASTFDTELMSLLGRIAADEARAINNSDDRSSLCLWGPTIDPVRDPRWGRVEEGYGEDVFLAGELARAYTESMAGDNGTYYKTVPTLKHFCANNHEQDRGRDDACFPLRLKYEYYYAPFRNAVKNGGARSLMASYNKVNGVPSACSSELQTVLKDKWGLWFVVTDGGGFAQIYTSHHYTDSHSETVRECLSAGCDSMTDGEELVKCAARRALQEGKITEADIDKTLTNTIFARLKLGMLDPDCEYRKISKEIIDCDEHRKINLRASLEQVCLLKNDGLLPLKSVPKSIAVVGAMADENLMDWYTGYSSGDISVLQGIGEEFRGSEVIHDSLWDIVAIKAANGNYLSADENGDVTAVADVIGESELFELQDWGENWINLFSVKYKRYVRLTDDRLKLHNRRIYDWFTRETFNMRPHFGKTLIEEYLHHRRLSCPQDGAVGPCDTKSAMDNMLFEIQTVSKGEDRAAKLASENELVIYCVGNYPVQVAQECYDRKTLALNVQEGMALKLCEANKNTVLAVISSYPYSIAEENDKLPAILYSSHAGAYLGTAIAQTLSGRNNPSAKTALTWYSNDNDLHDIKEYDIEKSEATYLYFKGKPLYPFGYGLSYSSFEYSDMRAEKVSGGVKITLDVKNTSNTDGTEVVQIYYTVTGSEVQRPARKLCGFARVFAGAGQTERAEITVPNYALEIYNVRSGEMMLESGDYRFFAAASSADVRCEASIVLEGAALGERQKTFEAQSFERSENIRISYSKKLHRHYVKVVGWGGSVSYGGVRFFGSTKLVLSAMASVTPSDFTVEIGDFKASVRVAPTDGSDDFVKYTIDLPSGLPNVGELSISMGDAAGLLDIELK